MINEKPLAKPENRVPEAIKDLKMAEGHLDVLELTQLPTYPVMTGRFSVSQMSIEVQFIELIVLLLYIL